MTKQEAHKRILFAGGKPEDFDNWMCGQTVGLNDDGSFDYYKYDVERFIRYKCNPNNEPLSEVD